MESRIFEVRDAATFIPALVIRPGADDNAERSLWGRAGYGTAPDDQRMYALLAPLAGAESGRIECDPYRWGTNRTLSVAHVWLQEQVRFGAWCDLTPGMVIDVEYLLGADELKYSEGVGERMLCNGVTLKLRAEGRWPGELPRYPSPA